MLKSFLSRITHKKIFFHADSADYSRFNFNLLKSFQIFSNLREKPNHYNPWQKHLEWISNCNIQNQVFFSPWSASKINVFDYPSFAVR